MNSTYEELGGRPSTAPLPARGCGARVCNHADRHDCPWTDDPKDPDRVQPCGCTHLAEPKKGGRP